MLTEYLKHIYLLLKFRVRPSGKSRDHFWVNGDHWLASYQLNQTTVYYFDFKHCSNEMIQQF